MAKRQLTLGSFGFTKSVTHRGKVTEISIPTTAKQDFDKLHKCPFCEKRFEAKKGLVIHVKCTHPNAETSDSSSKKQKKQKTDATNSECIETIVNNSLNAIITNIEMEIQASKEQHTRIGRRGKDRRQKYSAIKKSNVIDEFDAGASQEELAEKYNINRSLVSKWASKEREKIKAAADGSADDKICPEGLSGYQIPPPAIFLDPTEAAPVSNEVDPCNHEEQIVVDEVDINDDFENADCEDQCDDDGIMEDNEYDRCYDDELVGRQVKCLYENGWFVGTIAYFNENLSKYMIKYQDLSTDLVDVADFDGVEMIFI